MAGVFALIHGGRPQEGVIELREALRLGPRLAGAHNNLGIALQTLGELDAEAVAYRAAIRLEPGSYPARVNLDHLLCDGLHDYAGVASELREALRLKPGDAALLARLAQAPEWDGRPGEAAAAYDAFVRDFTATTAAVLFERGLLKPKLGDFASGWPALGRRHEARAAGGIRLPGIASWRGEPLDDTLALNTTTDGYGDALMAIRFAAEARRVVREIALLCRPAEARLLRRCGGIDRVVTDPGGLPRSAAQATVLGLASALGVTPETMGGGTPYLSPDDETIGRWWGPLEAVSRRFKVGVCWRGHPRHAADARRSFRLEDLAPLADASGVALISLRKGPGCERLAAARFPVVDLGFAYQAGDWLDTAAIISQFDLVVGPDTAVIHCAGGVGRPTRIAPPSCDEWRWLLDRYDSPWYSSVHLFRRAERGDWAGVSRRMAAALDRRPEA